VAASGASVVEADGALETMAELRAALGAERERATALERERDQLREAYQELQIEMELLRRRIFAAKAERMDTAQLLLEFAEKQKELDALVAELEPAAPATGPKTKRKPTGRRDLLRNKDLPVERLEIPDAEMEALVASGAAKRMGFEESASIKWRRGGAVCLVVARIKYRLAKNTDAADVSARLDAPALPTTLVTATMPPAILPRSLGTPSLYAKIAAEKFSRGMPLYRQEEQFQHEGCPIDRGTMCRWLEEIGAILGVSVVNAARLEAMGTAFCLATDATGIWVQPIATGDKKRQACKRGHFFVQIADRDHVFFEYTERETSKAVLEMFRGFSGYVQADAKSVYDILFRDPDQEPPERDAAPDPAKRSEVGCWSHGRRGFWEAAVGAKETVAREALFRIGRLFEYEEKWRGLEPAQRKAMRDRFSRPEVEDFLAWADVEYRKVEHQRGLLRSALGYVRNQKEALGRFLDDGRLEMENNRSERELRRIAVGRKAWLFVGSDDHAEAAANFFSVIASAKLHRLDPEAYLRDLLRVLPHWPQDRYLELAPKYWAATRGRLDPVELEREIGWLTIPPPPELSPVT